MKHQAPINKKLQNVKDHENKDQDIPSKEYYLKYEQWSSGESEDPAQACKADTTCLYVQQVPC